MRALLLHVHVYVLLSIVHILHVVVVLGTHSSTILVSITIGMDTVLYGTVLYGTAKWHAVQYSTVPVHGPYMLKYTTVVVYCAEVQYIMKTRSVHVLVLYAIRYSSS